MKVHDRWPFAPLDNLPEALQVRWWEECFLPTPAYEILRNQPHWAVIIGKAGCGTSTLLRALKQDRQSTDLVLDLSIGLQPEGKNSDSNLLREIMTQAAREFCFRFSDHQAWLEKISLTQREFLRWLIEKFLGHRPYLVFLDGLESAAQNLMAGVELVELYATQTETMDVQGQITELSNLSRSVGYLNLLVVVDTLPYASEAQLAKLVDFLGWLEPMHHRGFVVIVAITQMLFEMYQLDFLMRGRVKVIQLETSPQATHLIVGKRLSAATGGQIHHLTQMVETKLLNQLETMIEQEFGALAPGPLIHVTDLLLESLEHGCRLDENLYETVRDNFYLQHLPLRLAAQTQQLGVWRGHRFIPLDAGPYDLLKRLAKSRVETWGGKGGNEYLHTLASRLRKAIEPDPKNPIYVQNRRSEGYWLNGLADKTHP